MCSFLFSIALMIAREMGVPIYPVGVCNKNDSFYEMVTSGNRVMKDVEVSIAPAMDISVSVIFGKINANEKMHI